MKNTFKRIWNGASWLNLRYYFGCLDRLKKTIKKTSVRIVNVPAQILTKHLLNTRKKHYHFCQLAWLEGYKGIREIKNDIIPSSSFIVNIYIMAHTLTSLTLLQIKWITDQQTIWSLWTILLECTWNLAPFLRYYTNIWKKNRKMINDMIAGIHALTETRDLLNIKKES